MVEVLRLINDMRIDLARIRVNLSTISITVPVSQSTETLPLDQGQSGAKYLPRPDSGPPAIILPE